MTRPGLLGALEDHTKPSAGAQGPAIHATGKGLLSRLPMFACIVDCLLPGTERAQTTATAAKEMQLSATAATSRAHHTATVSLSHR